MNCPICGWEHFPAPARGSPSPAGEPPCPYRGLAYAALRAGHDVLYFGRWRGINATSIDIRRAHRQLRKLLNDIARDLETEHLPAARVDLEKAFEAMQMAGTGEEGQESLLHLDQALSYAHRVIGDLLHEKGARPHSPGDFAEWYDAAEVPFREDW